MAKTSCKKGQYYCNTDKKCKPIPEGYTVREDGFLVKEGWSAKYKKSIDCSNPKGFSQKAHCAGKKKKMTEESNCLLYTSPSPRDLSTSRMPSSA